VIVSVAPDVAEFVRPESFTAESLTVREADSRLDVPLEAAAATLRASPPPADVTSAVRGMYRRAGIDPTKTRPSSEALLRRVKRGEPLPRVNTLVDIINWCSVESALPYGLYDAAAIQGSVTLRLGQAGEAYAGIRKDTVHVAGRLTLADEAGAFGNPTSDSARTMVTTATTAVLVVIFAPSAVAPEAVRRAVELTRERIERYGHA
jgi:DNA/RNA-binding domain of Phe-tRNA-synthetase-like protein